jgi:hypothetical protein
MHMPQPSAAAAVCITCTTNNQHQGTKSAIIHPIDIWCAHTQVDGEVSSCAGIKAAELDVLRRMSVSIAGGGSSLGGGREGGVDQSMAKSFLQVCVCVNVLKDWQAETHLQGLLALISMAGCQPRGCSD